MGRGFRYAQPGRQDRMCGDQLLLSAHRPDFRSRLRGRAVGRFSSLPVGSSLLSGVTEKHFVKYLGEFPQYPGMTSGPAELIMRPACGNPACRSQTGGAETMRLLRISDVVHSTGSARMTIYRLERAGEFPARRRLGRNSVAWLDNDISAWIESRPAVGRVVLGSSQARQNAMLRPR